MKINILQIENQFDFLFNKYDDPKHLNTVFPQQNSNKILVQDLFWLFLLTIINKLKEFKKSSRRLLRVAPVNTQVDTVLS